MTENERLKAWVDERGCSIKWLADQIGWTRENLSKAVNGHVPVSVRLADVINAKFDIGLTGEKRKTVGQ